MKSIPENQFPPIDLRRRRFVQGVAGGVLAGRFLLPQSALAQVTEKPQILRGTEFDLEIAEMPVNFTGQPRVAVAVNGQVPGPTLYWKEGDTVTLRVTNRLHHPTSIHWHGLLLPFQMDGVPEISFKGIFPGETFVYQFPIKQSGTYWYHSHSHFQEQVGLYGPIVIQPKGGERFKHDREYVVMLTDWTDEDPNEVYEHLKQMNDYYNYVRPTFGDFVAQAKREGVKKAWQERKMWEQMRMSPRDLSDVSGATYTYLTNGVTPDGNWTGIFRPGEKVRLRFINGSASTFFDVRVPGLKMTVVSADGQDVQPVSVDEFRIAVAETYDVIVEPQDDRAYTIFSQAIDRSGYARATLAPRAGMKGAIPPLDPVPTLTMADMGMGGSHDMAGMSDATPQSTDTKTSADAGMAGMDMGNSSPKTADEHAGHGSSSAPQTASKPSADSHAGHGGSSAPSPDMVEVKDHAPAEFGPGSFMPADMVSTRLDDPGPGLRDNGRKVLTYADLHTVGGALDPRNPTREIVLHLTGNMDRFMWSFNGKKYSEAEPIRFFFGERLRIVLVNDTMMNHPIHLHGMFSEVEASDGTFQVRKHTVNVQPGHRVTYRVTADAPGRWAYHCHLLYHMEAGMFRAVIVE